MLTRLRVTPFTAARIAFVIALLAALPIASHAQNLCWNYPNNGQFTPVTVGDGTGGYLMAWQDDSPPENGTIHLAKTHSTGVVDWQRLVWTTNVVTAFPPVLASDRSTGAYLVNKNQISRYANNGTPFWNTQWTGTSSAHAPSMTVGASGDAWVAARVNNTSGFWLRVGRVQASGGSVSWTTDTPSRPVSPTFALDIAERAGTSFTLFVTDNLPDVDLRVLKLDASGNPLWGAEGVLMREGIFSSGFRPARVIPDESGGCFVLWAEYGLADGAWRVRLQHLDSAGAPLWGTNGILLDGPITYSSDDYPGNLSLQAYKDGDVMACWSRRILVSPFNQQIIHATRLSPAGAGYTTDWDAIFTVDASQPGTPAALYPRDWNISEIDAFGGMSIVYRERDGQSYRMKGRYLTGKGALTTPHALSSAFSDDKPRPTTYANLGSIIGVWDVDYLNSSGRDICGQITQSAAWTGFAQFGGHVTVPAGYSTPVTVDAINTYSGAILASTTASASGDYVLQVDILLALCVRVRVRLPDGTMAATPTFHEVEDGAWTTDLGFTLNYAVPVSGWGETPVPVTVTPPDATHPRAARAADGSLFVAWVEDRCSGKGVYAQKFNNAGLAQWDVNGVAVSPIAGEQLAPELVDDGSGGVFIVFVNRPYTSDIVGQHLSSSGTRLWGNGLTICNAVNDQEQVQLAGDTGGGIVLAWVDSRNSQQDIYGQRVLGNGTFAWLTNGLEVCGAIGPQGNVTLVGDGFGGAIIAWEDGRSGISEDIYAQRVFSPGVLAWATDGIPLAQGVGSQTSPRAAPAGGAGAFVIWTDYHYPGVDIVAQHVGPNGALLWSGSGAVVASGADNSSPELCADISGGLIAVWEKGAFGAERVYAQRLDSNGARVWPPSGFQVAAGAGRQSQPQVAANPMGGAFVAWTDERSGNKDVYAQRLSPGGSLSWDVGGRVVEALAGSESDPVLVTRGSGAAHVVWRRGTTADIYATVVENPPAGGGGCTKNCPSESRLVGLEHKRGIFAIRPLPFRTAVDIHFAVEESVEPVIGIFDVQGRQILESRLAEHPPGAWQWSWDGRDADSQPAGAGIYFVQIRLGNEIHTRRLVKLAP